jgi:hypothetical protein
MATPKFLRQTVRTEESCKLKWRIDHNSENCCPSDGKLPLNRHLSQVPIQRGESGTVQLVFVFISFVVWNHQCPHVASSECAPFWFQHKPGKPLNDSRCAPSLRPEEANPRNQATTERFGTYHSSVWSWPIPGIRPSDRGSEPRGPAGHASPAWFG